MISPSKAIPRVQRSRRLNTACFLRSYSAVAADLSSMLAFGDSMRICRVSSDMADISLYV